MNEIHLLMRCGMLKWMVEVRRWSFGVGVGDVTVVLLRPLSASVSSFLQAGLQEIGCRE